MKKFTYYIAALMISGATAFTSCDEEDTDNDGTEISTDTNKETSDNNTPSAPASADGFSDDEKAKANTASNAKMNQVDKDIIYYCNLARLDGEKFWTNIAKPYIKKSTSYTQSLEKDLKEIKGLAMMKADQGLYNAAKYHAEDMNAQNYFEHDSKDGTPCFDRIKKYYSGFACNENIAAGNSKALDIVMQWLVDEGVAKLGHRKAILSAQCKAVGIYTCKHPSWRYCSVMDFGTEVKEAM
ncbi:MAG: CAP domain-containing protein [Bacteroidales bacterium]|nr:CAP domain-containing protein [Bacteroidales bacterium]